MARAFPLNQALVDQANADVAVSQATVRSLQSQVSGAKIAVDKANVDLGAPMSMRPSTGVVASILVREGQTVNAVQAAPDPELRLAKMDVMTVKAQISEADVIRVHPGETVYFTILGDPNKRYFSTIRSVEPAPDTAGDTPDRAGQYRGLLQCGLRRAQHRRPAALVNDRPGQCRPRPGQGRADRAGRRAGQARPEDGSYERQGALGSDGVASTRKVKVGVVDSARFEAIDGLKAGDKVVVGDAWNAAVSGAPVPQPKAK